MKIQFHNLVKPSVSLNLGVAYLKDFKTVAVGFIAFSITFCWMKDKHMKNNEELLKEADEEIYETLRKLHEE